MKKNKKLIYIILLILGILLIGGGTYLYLNKGDSNPPVEEKQVSLKDDFYDSINYLNTNDVFQEAQIDAFRKMVELSMEIEEDDNYTNDNYFAFFETFDDTEGRDAAGLSDLKIYFDEIDAAENLDDFSDILVKVNYDLGINSFLNWELMSDLYDNSKNVIIFSPMVLEELSTFTLSEQMPSGLEFFTNDKYSEYKKAFIKLRIDLFKLYGYDEEKAKQLSDDINEFAKTIQEKSIPLDELTSNYMDYYKNYSLNEIKSIIKNLPIDKFLKKYGIENHDYFAIIDEGHIRELDNYYSVENLPTMKEILKLLILEKVATLYSTSDYENAFADCFSRLTGELTTSDSIREYFGYLKLKPEIMGSYLNIKYDEMYFTEVEKQEIIELINKIKNHYRDVINSSEWLSDSTKQEAIKKIDNIKTNVGYVQREEEESNLKLLDKSEGGTLLSNYILYKQNSSSMLSKEINKEFNAELNQFEVNAYYNPINNSINFPSAFRETYRNINDKYEIYGYVGTVIAHEISHAFDDNGSKYDEKGNLKNWWTEEDSQEFEELRQKIVDYYSKYEFYGTKVNGELTSGENISDLAAIKTIISIMESENASNEDYKKFFESYAKLWNSSYSEAMVKVLMLSDTHSPNKIRVNAVLSSMDKFYEVYDIKEGDGMYVPKEERVGLW